MNVKLAREYFSDVKFNKISFVDIDSRNVEDLGEYIENNPNRIIYNLSITKYYKIGKEKKLELYHNNDE